MLLLIRFLLSKRTIAIFAGCAIVLFAIGWAIASMFITCAPRTTTGVVGCGAPTQATVISSIIFFFAWILTVLSWVMALVKTYRVRAWVWLVISFLLPPVGPFLYGIFGPALPAHGRPAYIEGTPPTPIQP